MKCPLTPFSESFRTLLLRTHLIGDLQGKAGKRLSLWFLYRTDHSEKGIKKINWGNSGLYPGLYQLMDQRIEKLAALSHVLQRMPHTPNFLSRIWLPLRFRLNLEEQVNQTEYIQNRKGKIRNNLFGFKPSLLR